MHRINIKPESAGQTLDKLIAAIKTGYGDIGFSNFSFNAGFGDFGLTNPNNFTINNVEESPEYKRVRLLIGDRPDMMISGLSMQFRDGFSIAYADDGNSPPTLDINNVAKEPRFEIAAKLFDAIQKQFSVIRRDERAATLLPEAQRQSFQAMEGMGA